MAIKADSGILGEAGAQVNRVADGFGSTDISPVTNAGHAGVESASRDFADALGLALSSAVDETRSIGDGLKGTAKDVEQGESARVKQLRHLEHLLR